MRCITKPIQALQAMAVSAAVLASASVLAQDYPSKPVTIIVPNPPGGDSDVSARNLATTAQDMLGQPIIIMNKAGANGVIGSMAVFDAEPDGHTLLLARVGAQAILPAIMQDQLKYKWDDFEIIGLLEVNPVVCVVHPESKYKAFGDLVKDIQQNPGKLNYSATGPATVQNLAPQLLMYKLGLKSDAALAINYKGGNEATMAVMSKDVDFTCNNLNSMLKLIQAGKLRALLTTTPERVAVLPDVPTARQAGYPDLEVVVGWSALYGPKNMNKQATKRWKEVLAAAAKDPRWIKGNDAYSGIPKVLSPEDSVAYIGDNHKKYRALIEQVGIKME